MKIASIIGARPQFVKAAPLSRVLRENHDELIIHTGQHYDKNMSSMFFEDLEIPAPDYDLGVGSGSHGKQTAEMLERIESTLKEEQPDLAIVYGDTNSTIAGSLASIKLHIPIAHIESGLRSHNRKMPEEINRVVTDHISSILYTPTSQGEKNLLNEGIKEVRIVITGDIMLDSFGYISERIDMGKILKKYSLNKGSFILCTLHRPYNVDDPSKLKKILSYLNESGKEIVLPLHPRTKDVIEKNLDLKYVESLNNIRFLPPLGYLDFIALEMGSWKIATDSGGIQKEAYFCEKPCITIRGETEWTETVEIGWNKLVGDDLYRLPEYLNSFEAPRLHPDIYGNGNTAKIISDHLSNFDEGKIPL